MAVKKIVSGEELRKGLSNGISKLAKVVGSSLGPKGRNALIIEMQKPKITNDGITIAKAFGLEDEVENYGAEVVKQSSNKTCEDSGDGTTTSCIISNKLIQSSFKLINEGCDPVSLSKGLKLGAIHFKELLKSNVTNLTTFEQIENLATISSNNDNQVGKLIADAYREIGLKGIVTIEKGYGEEVIVDLFKGYKIDKGYVSQIYTNDVNNKICEFNNSLVLLCPAGINKLQDILPFVNQARSENKGLLIVTESGHNLIASLFEQNKENKIDLNICVINPPSYEEHRIEYLNDISVFICGKLSNGLICGECESIKITNDSCTLIGGKGSLEEIQKRINRIENIKDKNQPRFYNLTLDERIGKLNGTLAIIKIGAKSLIEKGELYDRYEDATKAVASGLLEGICAGGGHTLVKISSKMKSNTNIKDEQKGYQIVKDSLLEPLRILCNNSNENFNDIYKKILKNKKGYNFKTNKYEDLLISGVIDSVKVIRTAVENSISVSSTLILCENIIIN